ncbi:MAG: hypothetical protein IPG01_16755 [Chitinophagaceae bacterium]|nr:hypothetical protein [Chitinophagaceae bacterium]
MTLDRGNGFLVGTLRCKATPKRTSISPTRRQSTAFKHYSPQNPPAAEVKTMDAKAAKGYR